MYLKTWKIALIAAGALLSAALSIWAYQLAGAPALVALVVLLAAALLVALLEVQERLVHKLKATQTAILKRLLQDTRQGLVLQKKGMAQDQKNYRQIEALFSLFASLKIEQPLPPMRGWAISPDFAGLLVSLIRARRPRLIVELGSGLSTLICAYCLRELGEGGIISLDHEEVYAEKTRENLRRHGLEALARVVYAPLREVTLAGKTWRWYDASQLEGVRDIELLIVDGPPEAVQPLSRYPALPLLGSALHPKAAVILDDTGREDEKKAIELWMKELAGLTREDVETEKGTTILYRGG